ncbi:uncharacterized protein [Littorina saxatilis]|uniref:uncharacterized protein n=1 Tax=Littorina saxatilis TaxID=31220 RepID=UPI0038B65773
MCKSKPVKKPPQNRRTRRPVHFLNDGDQTTDNVSTTSEEEDEDYVFTIAPADRTVKLLIEEEPVEMIVDSGASCNIINSAVAAKLKRRGLEFESCHKTIHPYGSPPILARRCTTTDVQIAGRTPVTAEFLVIPGSSPPLLGRSTSEALGVLHIGVNHVRQDQDPLSQYPGICDGIGKLKHFEVALHIDKTVPPVARKHSRIPFHLRDKVAAELKKLETEDVIEKV